MCSVVIYISPELTMLTILQEFCLVHILLIVILAHAVAYAK